MPSRLDNLLAALALTLGTISLRRTIRAFRGNR